MPLLPLRVLPVNDSHDGPLLIRIDARPTGSVYVYVRRESDKQVWICKVRSLQEIMAPTQQARTLDITAIATCLYHGVAYDAFASAAHSTLPVEIHRKEVAFTKPETWMDDNYRLTMRVGVRSTAIAVSAPHTDDDRSVAEAIPVVDIMSDDVVFGLNFTPTDFDLDHKPPPVQSSSMRERTPVSVRSAGVAFPNSFLNWEPIKDRDFLRVKADGMEFLRGGTRMGPVFSIEVTVNVLHPKGAALFVFSVNSQAAKPSSSITFPKGDLQHTIAKYELRIAARSWLQVAMLPCSVVALDGSIFTLRETDQ